MVRKIALNKIEIIFNFFICFCVEPLSISPTSQLFLVTPPSFTHFFFGGPPLKCHFFSRGPPLNPTSPPMLIKNERSLKPKQSALQNISPRKNSTRKFPTPKKGGASYGPLCPVCTYPLGFITFISFSFILVKPNEAVQKRSLDANLNPPKGLCTFPSLICLSTTHPLVPPPPPSSPGAQKKMHLILGNRLGSRSSKMIFPTLSRCHKL